MKVMMCKALSQVEGNGRRSCPSPRERSSVKPVMIGFMEGGINALVD